MLAMITINLLPPEHRKKERTPLSRFIVLLVGVIILATSLAFFFYVRVSLVGYATTELANKETQLQQVNIQHRYYLRLVEQRKDYEQREETIQKIRDSRILWCVKLMQLYDLFALDDFRDKAWIDGLRVNMTARRVRTRRGRDAGEAPVGTMEFTLNTAGKEFTRLTDVREALMGEVETPDVQAMGEAFWATFQGISHPRADRHEDEDMEPPVWYSDDIKIDIKDPAPSPKAAR
jgi:hypothetical protein